MKDARIICPIKCKVKGTPRCRKTTCEKLSEALSIYPCPCPTERAGCDKTCNRLKEWHGLNEWRDGVSDSDFKSRNRISLPVGGSYDRDNPDTRIPLEVIDKTSTESKKTPPDEYNINIISNKPRYYKMTRSQLEYKSKGATVKTYIQRGTLRKELPEDVSIISSKELHKGRSEKDALLHKVVKEYSEKKHIPYETALLTVSKTSRKCKHCNNLIPVGFTLKGKCIPRSKTFCSDACKKAYQRKTA